MSAFTALNVEPEDTIEDEVDDTKEVQIEEAFKLYQNALKLHSQGPESYGAAAVAYEELFQSEVFKYPEVASDYAHDQLDDVSTAAGGNVDQEPIPLTTGTAADSAAGSLPQLVYLAYKNRAQFVLDVANHDLSDAPAGRKALCEYYYAYCAKSFTDSASALERDDTDLDLWKKAARIAETLDSQRLVRFCLESVLAGDDELSEQAVDLSGLDEAFASGELEKMIRLVQDDASQAAMTSVRTRDSLLKLLAKRSDPYPFLPPRPDSLEHMVKDQRADSLMVGRIDLAPADATLQSLGLSLLDMLQTAKLGGIATGALGNVVIKVPQVTEDGLHGMSPVDNNDLQETNRTENPLADRVSTKKLSPTDSPRSPASFHSAQDALDQELSPAELEIKESADAMKSEKNDYEREGDLEPNTTLADHKGEIRLPTRKRSSTAAGLEEPESRTKSKRLRARESLALEHQAQEDEAANEIHEYNQEQLRIIEDADEVSINYLNFLLAKFSSVEFESCSEIRSRFWREEDTGPTESDAEQTEYDLLLRDMRLALTDWGDERSNAVMTGHGTREQLERTNGLTLFLQHLKANAPDEAGLIATPHKTVTLDAFVHAATQTSMSQHDVLIMWLAVFLTNRETGQDHGSPYLEALWPPELKQTLVRIIAVSDEFIFERLQHYTHYRGSGPELSNPDLSIHEVVNGNQAIELVQSLFELHLDIFVSITNPDSQVNENMKNEQLSVLEKWASLASDCIQTQFLPLSDQNTIDPLLLRFVWASAKFASQTADDDKSHVLACLNDLRALLKRAGKPVIALPNNVAMPQISLAAIEQEISRLSTLDFFMSIFDGDNSDPLTTIMKLEPLLEPAPTVNDTQKAIDIPSSQSHEKMSELRTFLDSGDASLRLFLWRRLASAYKAVPYTPKVISCYMRSFEILVAELQTERHMHLEINERILKMLRWLRDSDDLLTQIVGRLAEEHNAFESFDEDHLMSSTSAVIFMLRLIHGFVTYDDAIRVGQMAGPTLRPSSAKLFDKSRDRLRETYVRLWTLLFYLLKEATVQFPDRFERKADELAEYLRNVHNALGCRQYCKHCNKIFVRLVKAELLAMDSDIDYSQDIAQILYDLYQLKFSPGIGDVDHGCTPELLRDKTTAMTLVPLIMTYAKRINPRDLIKSELKNTIEKIQQCLGQVKTSSTLSYNKRTISGFLKSPINPQTIYRAVKGVGDLMIKPVHGDYAKIAASGWYLLLGQMSLAKFRSVKRVSPTPTDDLDTAATYLRHDLEHNVDNWHSWYRLAQVFDAKIEDNLIWNSTKLNDARGDIVLLERNAINAYTMAMAMAMRESDDTQDSVQLLSDMFAEFAMRLYASSRPPLNMEAFSTDKNMRHLSSSFDQSMSKAPFVHPFQEYMVWKFAATLLRRRYASYSKEWFCHYTLGKCLWKMFQHPDNRTVKVPVDMDQVLDAFTDAVEMAPKKEKSSDPVLEPHYKIVSVVHKLVHRKLLEVSRAMEYLEVTPFAGGARVSEDEHGHIEWDPYVLDVLKRLGHADKSHWHHRIAARAAHIIYDDESDIAGALGAKHQFTLQIFTKTMTMQVWKPEFERAGRHYVYTGRYLTFFVHLLDQLNDRANMEQLVRRIRRKTTDFLNHTKVWEHTALSYVTLLRRTAKVPEGKERLLFDKTTYDDFLKMSEKVEKWAHEADTESTYLDIIRDAIELKKLNNSLMKGPAIDDLIGDTYAAMYEQYVAQLPPEEVAPPKHVLTQGTFINMTTEAAPTGDDKVDRMRLNNLLSAQVDGGLISAVPAALSAQMGLGVQTPPRATPPADIVRLPTPNKPGRAKTITKREIQRKAEAATNRPATVKTPILGKKFLIELPKVSRNESAASHVHTPDEKEDDGTKDEGQDESRLVSRRSSAAGSARVSEGGDDDNDDEEEEEIDEEEDQADDGNEEDLGEDDDGDEKSETEDNVDSSKAKSLLARANGRKRKAETDAENEVEEDDDEAQDGDEEDNDEDEGDDEEGDSEKGDLEGDDPDDTIEVGVETADQIMEIEDSQELNNDSDGSE